MATEEAVIGRRVAADARVSNAVKTLTERHEVEAAEMPSLPREVDPSFRAMIEREVLADTLERLADSPVLPDQSPELIDALEAADERVRLAVVALSGHAGLIELTGVVYPSDASLAEQRVAIANAVATNLEAIVGALGADARIEYAPIDLPAMVRMATYLGIDASDKLPGEAAVIDAPDLTAMTRDELNVMATDLGVDSPDKLPNKTAVIDAITAARKAT